MMGIVGMPQCDDRYAYGNRRVSVEPHRPARILSRLPRATFLLTWTRRHRRRLIAALVLVTNSLGFVTSIRAVIQTRTAQGATAWAISLNPMP
jgi:hypothetical protein